MFFNVDPLAPFFLKMSDLVSLLHGSGSATPFRRSGKVFSVFLENGLLCHSRVFFGKPAEYVNCGSETHPSVVFFLNLYLVIFSETGFQILFCLRLRVFSDPDPTPTPPHLLAERELSKYISFVLALRTRVFIRHEYMRELSL